jgi:hypothetical protein
MKTFLSLLSIIASVYCLGFSQTPELEKVKYITGSNVYTFVSKINEFGKTGYQLKSVVNVSEKYAMNIQYAGLVEFVGKDKIFEYKSQYANGVSTVVKILTSNQNDGFSVVDSVPIFENGNVGICIYDALLCKADVDSKVVSGNMLFFERSNQTKMDTTYEFVDFGEISFDRLEMKVQEFVLRGYVPLKLFFSQSEQKNELVFVMQKQAVKPPEIKFVNQSLGFNKKIDSLTNDGFALHSALYLAELCKLSVLLRYKNGDPEISKTIDAKSVKPNELLKSRLKFKSVLWKFNAAWADSEGYERGYEKEKLQFIEPTDSKTEYSYKIVKMKQLKPGKRIDSVEPSNEATSEYKSLVAQGYSIKDLYIYNGINMLLEKVVK